MKPNVGGADRVLRVLAGIALLASIPFIEGGLRWIGLVGMVPLLTGLARWCPLYSPFGINTCPKENSHD
jgi:hypothetical protein